MISAVFFPRFLDNCNELFLFTEEINKIECVVLIAMMTLMSCLVFLKNVLRDFFKVK